MLKSVADEPAQVGGIPKMEQFKHLGQVRVECLWVRETSAAYTKPIQNRVDSAFGSNVPEKCLKGRAISNHATWVTRALHY